MRTYTYVSMYIRMCLCIYVCVYVHTLGAFGLKSQSLHASTYTYVSMCIPIKTAKFLSVSTCNDTSYDNDIRRHMPALTLETCCQGHRGEAVLHARKRRAHAPGERAVSNG